MDVRRFFSSRRLFIFNIALTSMLLGSFLTIVAFSCTTQIRPARTVFAQDREPLSVEDLSGVQSSFRSVAEYVLPSVVEIRIVTRRSGDSAGPLPFDFFFGPGDPGSDGEVPSGLGSGVIVRRKGDTVYAVTNAHVAANANEITVVTRAGDEFTGTLVGTDPRRDLAVVSFVESSSGALPIAPLGDSDDLYVGDWVLAIGNPFGFASTVTAGIVSAKERLGPADNISDFIQTDAAINRGNSGGPLVNLKGEIVGINTWITTPTGINVGLGFAIPINNAKRAIADIIDLGSVEYGWLGVEVEDVRTVTAGQLGFDRRDGAVVSQVFGDSPASRGGILPGDIVTEIDGTPVRDYPHLVRLVGDKRAGESTVFTIFRQGDVIERTVTIGTRESDSEIERANRTMWPGLAVVPLGESLKATLHLPRKTEGLLIEEVKPAAAPQAAGIRTGDVLLAINDVDVKNLLDFYRVLNDTQNRDFNLEILRSGEVLSFSVRRG